MNTILHLDLLAHIQCPFSARFGCLQNEIYSMQNIKRKCMKACRICLRSVCGNPITRPDNDSATEISSQTCFTKHTVLLIDSDSAISGRGLSESDRRGPDRHVIHPTGAAIGYGFLQKSNTTAQGRRQAPPDPLHAFATFKTIETAPSSLAEGYRLRHLDGCKFT